LRSNKGMELTAYSVRSCLAPASSSSSCLALATTMRCQLFKAAIPVLHVSSSATAEEFYCNRLGFRRQFAYRADEAKPDPCYMGLTRDGVRLHVSSFSGDGVSGGVVFLLVEDVDTLHAELVAKGVPIDLAPTDQTWGNREMYVHDPDGNSIRFVHEGGG
jgi:catechol 2,3-dioxygenase-like lactoylglutathione lyase family enzyme